MAKQPQFLLMRIVRKSDGKCFAGFLGCRENWTRQGAFFRQDATIRKHLYWLVCERDLVRKEFKWGGFKWMREATKPDDSKYSLYYIEAFKVQQLETAHRIEASKFCGIK